MLLKPFHQTPGKMSGFREAKLDLGVGGVSLVDRGCSQVSPSEFAVPVIRQRVKWHNGKALNRVQSSALAQGMGSGLKWGLDSVSSIS